MTMMKSVPGLNHATVQIAKTGTRSLPLAVLTSSRKIHPCRRRLLASLLLRLCNLRNLRIQLLL